ncbi:MAG TPA: NUDIX hydrolase [Firmicutes bacterium]|nr:NUDIX hydrolase [Bacillota bacterium]
MEKVFSRVIIRDECHHVLVIQDRGTKWNFPGGKKEALESPMDCAIREVKEEVDLHIHQLTEFYEGDFVFNDIKWRGHFYFAEVVSGVPKINEVDKIKDLTFIKDLTTVEFSEQLADVIHLILNSECLKTKTTSWV